MKSRRLPLIFKGGRTRKALATMALVLVLNVPIAYGQQNQLSTASMVSPTTITRNWNDRSQIIYSQNRCYDQGLGADVSNSQFILAPYDSTHIKISKALPISQNVYITDMEVLEDTLFFCGRLYQDSAGTTLQRGLIGYFSIPDMFYGTEDFHILQFNRYPIPTTMSDSTLTGYAQSQYIHIKYPTKLEVFKTDSGMHIACVGLWGSNSIAESYYDYFVADVVHKFNTNHWWYYVSIGNHTEAYSDIAVTDNYIATIATKYDGVNPNSDVMYSRLFYRPTTVSQYSSNSGVSNMFQSFSSSLQPLYQYLFDWIPAEGNYLNPHIIHTHGDSLAVVVLSKYRPHKAFGTVVTHAAIADMLRATGRRWAPIYPTGDMTIGISTSDEPYEAIEGLGEDTTNAEVLIVPSITLSRVIQPLYSRIINQQDPTDYSCDPYTWTIPEVRYNRRDHEMLVVTSDKYPFRYYRDSVIYAFDIYDTAAPVKEYWRPQHDISIVSVDTLQTSDGICLSGDEKQNTSLLFGTQYLKKTDSYDCLKADDIISYQPDSKIGINNTFGESVLSSFCVDSYDDRSVLHTAFQSTSISPYPNVDSLPTKSFCK